MTKRFLFLLVAMVGMTLQSVAQTTFNVKMPPFRKYVKVINDGVNLRQRPDVKSPRLVWTKDGIDGYDPEYLAWKGAKLKKGDKPVRATVLPVWEEVGDWYRVHYCVEAGEEYYNQTAYVMKKFCKEVQLRPLTLPAPNDMDIVKVNGGKYNDYCFRRYIGWGDEQKLQIGKYNNGMFILNYEVGVSYNQDGENIMTDDGLEFNNSIVKDDWLLDLSKLTRNTKIIDELFRHIGQMDYNPIIYYGITEDKKWYPITGIN